MVPFTSGSASRSAVLTSVLHVRSSRTTASYGLPFTSRCTMSPAFASPPTVPVMVVFSAFASSALIQPSPAITSISSVTVGSVVSTCTGSTAVAVASFPASSFMVMVPFTSGSASRSAVFTSVLQVRSSRTTASYGLPFTSRCTTSPAFASPPTVPVMVVFSAFASSALIQPSPPIGSISTSTFNAACPTLLCALAVASLPLSSRVVTLACTSPEASRSLVFTFTDQLPSACTVV